MSFDMIYADAASKVIATLTEGCNVFITYEGDRRYYKVISWTPYSVTFQIGNNKVVLPVTVMDAYHEELATMGLQALPTSPGAAKRRGRPPANAAAQAPTATATAPTQAATGADQPFDPSAWGGPGGGTLAADVAKAETAVLQPKTATPAATTPAPKQITIEEAEGNQNWAVDSVDQALDTLGEHLRVVIDRLAATRVAPQPAPAETTRTCGDCLHALISVDLCGKYNMRPPMKVVVDAKTMCPDFEDANSEEIPF
jgi:hypothetical protein